MTYNVVFEFGEDVKTFGVSISGLRTLETFESKESFEKYYTTDTQKRLKVVAQGIPLKEAEKLSIPSLENFLTNISEKNMNRNI